MNSPTKAEPINDTFFSWESWAGEVRINLIRLVALAIFYAHHLARVYLLKDAPLDLSREIRIITLVISYGVLVAALYYVLRLGRLHPSIKYMVTAWDILMIGAIIVTMDGPRSVFSMLFLLPISASILRLSLPLVYFSTALGALAYLAILAYYVWFVVGSEVYYSDSTVRIPRSEQVVVLFIILTAGLLAGQAVRQVRRIIQSLRTAQSSQS
jgi:hypothetical protein